MAELPHLKQMQNKSCRMKKAKQARVVINNMLELKRTLLLHHKEIPRAVSTALVPAKKS